MTNHLVSDVRAMCLESLGDTSFENGFKHAFTLWSVQLSVKFVPLIANACLTSKYAMLLLSGHPKFCYFATR